MALVYTPNIEANSACPDFELPGLDGKQYTLSDFADKELLVALFICNHCPYVQAIEDRYINLSQEMTARGVQFIGICSNDAKDYPEDSFERLKERWELKKYGFPYLHDESQSVAKSFGAVCTPDIFLYNKERKLIYRGRLDDSWKDATAVKKQDLKNALLAALEGANSIDEQVPSMGCSIKWK